MPFRFSFNGVKILFLIWANVTRTYVAWTNVTVTVFNCWKWSQEPTSKVWSKSANLQLRYSWYGKMLPGQMFTGQMSLWQFESDFIWYTNSCLFCTVSCVHLYSYCLRGCPHRTNQIQADCICSRGIRMKTEPLYTIQRFILPLPLSI